MGWWALLWMGGTGAVAVGVLWWKARADALREEALWLDRLGGQGRLGVELVAALEESGGAAPKIARRRAIDLVREIVDHPEVLGEFAGVKTRNLGRMVSVMQFRSQIEQGYERCLKDPDFRERLEQRLPSEEARLLRDALERWTTRPSP